MRKVDLYEMTDIWLDIYTDKIKDNSLQTYTYLDIDMVKYDFI